MLPKTIHKITIINPIEAECSATFAALVKETVSFPAVYYRQGIYRKERNEYTKSMMTKGKGGVYYFWAGLVDRIAYFCEENGIDYTIIDNSQENIVTYEPELPDITFRDDQIVLINTFLDKPRGTIVSFTGSGKTILGFGILSAYPGLKTLWLCHKIDLVEQTYKSAIELGFTSVGRYGGGRAEGGKDLTISTRQSFKKLTDEQGHEFDIVVVDEVHHVAKKNSQYQYVLSRIPAPIRLGLTATLMDDDSEEVLVCEGLIGPVLGELTINEGSELGILAEPRIKCHRLQKDFDVADLRKYADVYAAGVTHNLALNLMVAQIAKTHSDKNETVLIIVDKIAHGHNIVEQLYALDVECKFVWGATKTQERVNIKEALNLGFLKVVVASIIWVEGVDIPNLNAVINAAGGKSEKNLLQKVGRGLRKTSEKDEVFIHDFFNPSHRFLIEHFGERFCIYCDNGWM